MSHPTRRVRHVLHRKRSVIADSLVIVRHSVIDLRVNHLLRRVVLITLSGLFLLQIASRAAGHDPFGDEREVAHTISMGVRLLAIYYLQYVVSAVLYRRWSRNEQSRFLGFAAELTRMAPGLALMAAIQATLDRPTSAGPWASALQTSVALGFSFVVYYAVPAAAVYRCGAFKSITRSYAAFRATFGTDLLAWSGMWIISGLAALIGVVPEAFDLYETHGSSGLRLSLAGRLFNWLALLPWTMVSQAIAAAFVTVIFFAFDRNRAPDGYPHHAVETVSGLRLER